MADIALFRRLEPRQPLSDLDRGFRAEIADPLWFLGRQWQLGEHTGEDASSPVLVDATTQLVAVDPLAGNPDLDPARVALEGVIEREASDWWTIGRRAQLGKAYADANALGPAAQAQAHVLLRNLPPPYDGLNDRAYDGHVLWLQDPAHAVFAGVPADPPDRWDPAELVYSATLTAGGTTLHVPRHDGGRLDWYSVDAAAPVPVSPAQARTARLLPNRMTYPGAPNPRWWEIEDHHVDIGGFPPDRGHFATMLLVDLVVNHADDWFTFPVRAQAGSIVRFNSVQVTDSFDQTWPLAPPANWDLFRVRGLDATSLVVWPSVTTMLQSEAIEDVLLGIDEDANAVFAVEVRANGADLATEPAETGPRPPDAEPVDGSARIQYRYRPSIGVRRYWHPYVLQQIGGRRRFVQGRLANLEVNPPQLFPEPIARVLFDQTNFAEVPGNQVQPVHQIEPSTIPRFGLRLQRQWVLARDVDGNPRLWIQRRRLALHDPPRTTLRFDTLTRELPPP
jgi:hypothetical protein